MRLTKKLMYLQRGKTHDLWFYSGSYSGIYEKTHVFSFVFTVELTMVFTRKLMYLR
jgi:hypothetical protein